MNVLRGYPLNVFKKLSVAAGLSIGVLLAPVLISQVHAEEHASGHGSEGRGHSGGSGHEGREHGRGREGKYDPGREQGHGGGAKAVENVILKSGGRPSWAQEGIPDVELGRLNVARVPEHVLQRALAQAHQELQEDPTAEIHAPMQNIALYKEAVNQGDLEKAARYLGSAAEKRVPISSEMVEALNIILGISVQDNAALANSADQVRQSILEAHDAGETTVHH